jgi:Zn finger protein HypA/HybF involved in hydrogenase expression
MQNLHKRGGGPSGNCICLKCGTKVPHQAGTPCMDTQCPQCGAKMVREGSEHHLKYLEKVKKPE